MNKINPIFEALSNVDERHIRANKKRSAKRIKHIFLAAAAAAALIMMAGFVYRNEIVRFKLRAGVKSNYGFSFKLTLQEYIIPEEF